LRVYPRFSNRVELSAPNSAVILTNAVELRRVQVKRIRSVGEFSRDTFYRLIRVKIDDYRNELCSHIGRDDLVLFSVDLLLDVRSLAQMAWRVRRGDNGQRRGAYRRR
jgi:hypothetical protein